MEQNLPPFYVGQKVVAIEQHSQMKFKKGEKYTVLGIVPSFCKCGGWIINIGIAQTTPKLSHEKCNSIILNTTGWTWFSSIKFAPIEENFQSISLEKILEEETKLISVN